MTYRFTPYYHELVLRAPSGDAKPAKIIGSDADNIADAIKERIEIAKQYHTNQIFSLVTLGGWVFNERTPS